MRVLLAGDRPQDREQGRRAALRAGLECALTDCVPLADIRHRLSREPGTHLVVVFLEPDLDAATHAIRAAAGQTRQPIFAVTSNGTNTDPTQLVADVGVAAVWHMDQVREKLLHSAEELRRSGRSPDVHGRVISVIGAQAGIGVTTVATGVAFGLVGKNAGSVILAELGMGIPELALDLDLVPRHSIADLVVASGRLDLSMLREAVARHEAGVDVLAYSPETMAASAIDEKLARDFEILLRSGYNWAVVDVGHMGGAGAGVEELVRQSDMIIVVTRLDPPALRMTRSLTRLLTQNGVPETSLMVVANRFGQAGQIAWRKAQEALRTDVKAWIPEDPRSINRALADGKPLVQVAGRARVTRELKKLAALVQSRFTAAR